MTQDKINLIISKLAHDLRNNLLTIRVAAGAIQKHIAPSDILEEKIALINSMLDQANSHIETARQSLISTDSQGDYDG